MANRHRNGLQSWRCVNNAPSGFNDANELSMPTVGPNNPGFCNREARQRLQPTRSSMGRHEYKLGGGCSGSHKGWPQDSGRKAPRTFTTRLHPALVLLKR